MTIGSSIEATARILLVCTNEASVLSTGKLAGALADRAAITRVTSGRNALETLRFERYDAVLLELASLADLAAEPEAAVARLVRLSADALVVAMAPALSVSTVMAVMGAGAHDYVASPLAAADLAARIAELAERHGKGAILAVVAPPAPVAPQHPAESANENEAPHIRLVTTTSLVLPMWQQEQRIIEEAIATFGGNIALAAAALELSPSTIYRKRQAWAHSGDKRGAA